MSLIKVSIKIKGIIIELEVYPRYKSTKPSGVVT